MRWVIWLFFLVAGGFLQQAWAFQQPPANFGVTSFLDGGPVPPGVYLVQYLQFADGREAIGSDGDPVPGGARSTALAGLTQIFYVTRFSLAGGALGLDMVIPVAAPTGDGFLGAVPVTSNTGGLGDIALGPALQWNHSSLLGRPLFHRLEVDAILPTGKYDTSFSANPGSNLLTLEPYYSFTWLFAPGWETSGRLLFAVHGRNDKTDIRPGPLFHLNYAVSRQVLPRWRLGASGYFLHQVRDDRVGDAASADSKERAFALGPGLVYSTPSVTFLVSHPVEFGVRNRFRGSRTTLQIIHRFE
ncbi:MAG: transporter [Elusimicrobia bacterium]|nr:transporter [Elusimicrobiota bacterium]